jgi:hypothetical protein
MPNFSCSGTRTQCCAGRLAHLGEVGVCEDLAASDVQFAPGDLFARWCGHRVYLQGPGEGDGGGGRQRVGDPALAVPPGGSGLRGSGPRSTGLVPNWATACARGRR